MVSLTYNYSRVSNVSTPPDFSTLVPNVFANPSINNEGYVDFEGFVGGPTDHLPPSVIYSGNGKGAPKVLIDNSKYLFKDDSGNVYSDIFFSSSSNNAGTTVIGSSGYQFGGSEANASGPTAIITVNNGAISNVAYDGTPFITVPIDPSKSILDPVNDLAVGSFVSAPGINDAGTVAFLVGFPDGTSSLLTKSINGDLATIATTKGDSPLNGFFLGGLDVGRGQGPFAKYTLPAINDKGAVAFNSNLKGGGKGIFLGDGSNVIPIATTFDAPFSYFSVPSINNSDTVVFNAGFTNGSSGIYEVNNGKVTTAADTSSGSIFKSFKSDVALNQSGDLAFLADLNDGGTAIFTRSASGLLNKVISVGDSLDGSTVTGLFISHKGLNDLGQVAFDAQLATGGLEVFRADPAVVAGPTNFAAASLAVVHADPVAVPEPSSFPLLGLAVLCLVGYRWQRCKQYRNV